MPLNFLAIDFETANFDRASVCAVGVTKVADGRIVLTESWFIDPPTGPHFTNTHVHGIGPEHVTGAVSWQHSLLRISQIAEGTPLVAYSSFDEGAYNAANALTDTGPLAFEFLDCLAVVRGHCDLPRYKLPLVVAHFGLPPFAHHEAGADSLACAQVMLKVAEQVGADTVHELWASIPASGTARSVSRGPAGATAQPGGYRVYPQSAPLPKPSVAADPGHPLFGEVVCFSGNLDSYSRPEAQQLVAALGAKVSGSVTKKTTLVVMGGFDPETLRPGATLSTKIQRARELAAAGQPVEIVTEQTFLEILRL